MSADDSKAVIELKATDLFVGHTPSGHPILIDTDHTRNSAPTPMELLLIALGSCTGVDVVSILKKKRQQVTGYHVEVAGQRREEHPRSYTQLEVKHVVRGHGISKEAVARAIGLSDTKY